MHGGKRKGSGRKKVANHLRRNLLTIRLPHWMILQLKKKGEIGCVIEYQLLKSNFIHPPIDYKG